MIAENLIKQEIKNISALQIANNIRSKKWSARQVMEAVLELAKEANETTNSIVLIMEKEALNAAVSLDFEIETGKEFSEEEYPFLGVPISIKDFLHVKDWPTYAGYSEVGKELQKEDAKIVQVVRKMGCIPYCKTNVPQFGLSTETANPVFGTTTNPFNPEYTCGGSSGGEGALIGAGGSVLGIGSDIGGSLRIPASFCGIYSFKPTPGRLPIFGHMAIMSGQDSINTTTGPMGKTVEDIEAMFKYIMKSQPWKLDSLCTKTPYEPYTFEKSKKFKIGYILNNNLFPSTPACERAVLEVVDLLKREGHEVFEFELPRCEETYNLEGRILLSDGLENAKRFMSRNESYSALTAPVVRSLQIPNFLVRAINFLLTSILGQKTLADIFEVANLPSVSKLWNLQEEKHMLSIAAHDAWIQTGFEDGHEMDILIAPVSAMPPQKHNTFMNISPTLWPCMVFNLLNYPSGVIPVTKVDHDLDRIDNVDEWLKEKLPEDYIGGTWSQKLCYSYYNSKEMAGLPIGIQVAGRKSEDEKVLEFMKYIDGLVKESVSIPTE